MHVILKPEFRCAIDDERRRGVASKHELIVPVALIGRDMVPQGWLGMNGVSPCSAYQHRSEKQRDIPVLPSTHSKEDDVDKDLNWKSVDWCVSIPAVPKNNLPVPDRVGILH